MSLKCRIFRDEKGQIDFVNAPNGNRSKLFDNLVDITGGNKNTALNIYALTEVEELKEGINTKLNALKERFKSIVKVAPADVSFSIVGVKGAQNLDAISGDTVIVDNLEVAIEMEKSNETPLKIKIATGWQRGADNQWKYELDSSKASLNLNIDSMSKLGKKYSLKSILKYPELFKAYPELNDVKLSVSKKGGTTTEGYFNGTEIVLGIESNKLKDFFEAKSRLDKYKNLDPEVLRIVNKNLEVDAYEESLKASGVPYSDAYDKAREKYPYDERQADLEILQRLGYAEMTKSTVSDFVFLAETDSFYKIVKDFKEGSDEALQKSDFNNLNAVLLPVTLHEIQHWIQQKEGFARGSNTTGIYLSFTEEQKNEYKDLVEKKKEEEAKLKGKKWYDAPSEIRDIIFAPTNYLYQKYRSAMGEEEARNVEKRLKMTPKERLYSMLQDTEDVARDNQIFIPQNRTSYNTISEGERSAYEAEVKRKEGFALSQNTDWARDEWFKMLVYSDNRTIMKMTETAKPTLLIKVAEQYGLNLKDGNQRLAAMSAVRKEAVRQNKELFGRANDEQVISEVIDKLKESGLANNVYQMSDFEIQSKLVEIGETNANIIAAGFTYKGDVYLNKDAMRLDTPIHEFGHLHLDWLKANRNDLYEAGISLLDSNSEEAQKYIKTVRRTQPNLEESSEKFKNEVLAQIIGDQGAKLVNSKKEGSIADWLNNVWEAIKDILGLSNYTAEEVANMTLAEFGRSSAAEMLSGRGIKGGSGFFTSGVNFSKIYKKPVFEGNADIDRIKGLEVEGNEDGATFNLDGSTYTGGGLVVPAISFNTTQEELSKEAIEKFIEENQDKIGGSSVKVGLYKFKDSNQVSIDLNIVVKPEHQDIALAFGRFAGQESLFNLDTFENIPTGADGKNPKNFTSEEFRQISESLSVGEFPQFMSMSPSNSSNYANLTEDGQGNFVFYHVGNDGYETIQVNSGATTATSKEESAALAKVGGLAMYYTRPEDGETMVSGSSKYMVKIPMSKVYDFNTDVLNLYDVAKEEHEKKYPGKSFDPNSQVAYITKIAGDLGYEMVVSQWKNITRAQSVKEFSPVDTQILNGNVISKPFENSYDSNSTKGYKSVIPVRKEEKLKSFYLEINSERNAQNRYDSLYNLYVDYYKKTQKEITDMIENSDISQGLKDKYKELVNEEEGSRMSIFNPPSAPVSTRQPSLEKDGVKIFAKERTNPATGEKLDGIEWELIESSDRGKGNARKVAELFLNGTDAQGKDVYLTVSPRDKETKPERLESFYSSLGFEKTSDFEMVRRAKNISLKDLDSNGEPSINTLMNFSNSKVKPLGLEGLKAAKNAAMALKVKSSQELIEKMEKALMKNGIVLFDKLSLQRSKLYNTFEINTILSSPKLQKQIKDSILALRNSEPFTIEYDENFIIPQGREVNQFGKQEVINPNVAENDLIQSVAGLKESEIDEALPTAFANKYYSDSDFRDTVDSIARDYKKAPVKTVVEGELVDKVEDVEGMLLNTITDDSNDSISEDIMFLREEIDDEIFSSNLEKVSKVLNKIKKNAYINGIDLRNFPTLALELSRAELLGFLDSMEDAISNPDSQEDLKDFSERYSKILGDKEAKTEIIKSNSENDVIVEEPLSEYEMFSKFGLVKKDDNIYRQVTEESLDTLYENFFEYKNLLPEGIETLEALKYYVQKNANQLEVSDYEVDVDNLEKMFLYKKFFDFPMSTQKARVKTDNFNKITNSEGYLTDIFMKEFNKWILATANPYFKVTGKGIELVNNDELSKAEAVNSVPEKFKQELAEYNIISDSLNLDMPLPEEKYEDINTQLEQRQKAVNNPDRVKKVSGQYTYLKDGVLAAKNESETFVKTPIGIFEKIFEFENIKFYGKLDTDKKQGYKKVNVEAPFSDINFKDYSYLANSPESFKTSKNYYSRKELNDINDEYFGCQ
jgi:hypothetical protein